MATLYTPLEDGQPRRAATYNAPLQEMEEAILARAGVMVTRTAWTTLNTAAPSITIPVVAGDNTLVLMATLRTDVAADNDSIRIVINGDVASTYLTRFVRVDTTDTVVAYSAITGWQLDYAANGATSTSGLYGYLNFKIPLASDLLLKSAQYDSVVCPTVAGTPRLCSGSALYPVGVAVAQIQLFPVNGTNFVSGSRYMLIGMA